MTTNVFTGDYYIFFLQIAVTLVFAPLLSTKILKDSALVYGRKAFPSASSDLSKYLKSAFRLYWASVSVVFVIASTIVFTAFINQSELLNWDNQSGVMLLYLMAMMPIGVMYVLHRRLFKVLKQHGNGKRAASLKPRRLSNFVSKPLIALAVLGNIVFVGTVIYFAQYPFDGFAGYANLFGLLLLNVVFVGGALILFHENKNGQFMEPEYRDAFKKKSIQINLLILVLVLFHVSLSMWVAGTSLSEYKLISQSLFLQLVLVISSFTLTLPKAVFKRDVT